MHDHDPTIGHRLDRSYEEMQQALSMAALDGDEVKIMSLQQEMRRRFGDLF